MNRSLIFIFLIISGCSLNAQKSFEGFIKFKTEISTTELAPDGFKKLLNESYGDSLIMYYSSTGKFRRVHLNSAENGRDSQFYFPNKDKLYLTYNNSSKIDSLDVKINSLKFISRRKIENQKIMNLNCECYEYKAASMYNQNVTLNYCYHPKSPKINPKFYSEHNDFFLNEYYKLAKRPYLKFSIETDEFKINYTATEFIEKKIEEKIFELR